MIAVNLKTYSDEIPFPMIDMTGPPKVGVVVEWDEGRGVLYVHVDGQTVLRICRIRPKRLYEYQEYKLAK